MSDTEFGSDGQLHPADKPTPFLTAAADPFEPTDSFEASEPGSAAQRIRAFEDEHLGKDAVRINGHIERGYGSPFKALPAEKHAEHAALEKLVEAEQKVIDKNAELSAAISAHEAAQAAVEAAVKTVETKAAEAKKAEADKTTDKTPAPVHGPL